MKSQMQCLEQCLAYSKGCKSQPSLQPPVPSIPGLRVDRFHAIRPFLTLGDVPSRAAAEDFCANKEMTDVLLTDRHLFTILTVWTPTGYNPLPSDMPT